MANEKKIIVKWEQENYPGDYPSVLQLSQTFDSKDEADRWVNQMKKSANAINRSFDILSIEEVD